MSYQQIPRGSYSSPPGGIETDPYHVMPSQSLNQQAGWWIIGGAGCVGSLFLAVCVYLATQFAGMPVNMLMSYTIESEARNSEAVYELLCEESKRRIPFETFDQEYFPKKRLKTVGVPTDLRILSNDPEPKSVVSLLTYEDGSRERVTYDVVKEHGEWRVCNPTKPVN